ncbi:MAG TPA: hypothetical protein ENL21_07780 [Caldithrix abyssi]|uniref:TonB-dependent receptor plug domain-containing protein n=1 Tax=Caldithrix abyssi TaxID=187145 RepID=A0A7V5H4F5_CALAY|nr:hypothetical protein [Caldithrix abyssi]
MRKIILFSFTLIAIFYLNLQAGNTGKLVGVVVDRDTGEPLIGANVIIKGTLLGAATDLNGYYYIINIPPGTYEVEFSYVGYQSLTVKNVRINVDLTTELNAKLSSTMLETEAIEVMAERSVIQRDLTSTKKYASGQELNESPGIESSADVFKVFGGAVLDTRPQSLDLGNGMRLQVRDESVKDVHIRGGRGGEILFMVDGVPMTHPLYGGRSVLELNVNDIEEIELITGGFNAEYGQAQSGVINITTKSGKTNFESSFEYKNDHFLNVFGASYKTDYFAASVSGPFLPTEVWLKKSGLDLPGRFSYYLSANGTITNTPYDNHRQRETLNYLGLKFKERQDNALNINVKLDWDNEKGLFAALSYHGTIKDWSRFDWLWRYYPDHTVDYHRRIDNLNFKIRHALSKSTFYNINFGYLTVNYQSSLNGRRPVDFWQFYPDSASFAEGKGLTYDAYHAQYGKTLPYRIERFVEPPTIDPVTGFFDVNGFETAWRDDNTRTFTFRGDISSQVDERNLVKFGLEAQYNDLQYVDIQDGGLSLSPYGNYIFKNGDPYPQPPGPFPEFGQNRWVFHTYPWIGAAYIQDKFEHSSLIINAGMRFDWFAPGTIVHDKEWKKQWELATGLKANWKSLLYTLSPRFGISFPFSINTVLFFSYGHFTQIPELQFYYRDPYTGSFTGNPGLNFEKTILYEFGFTHKLGNFWSLDVKSYAKDISEQVGTTHLKTAFGIPVDLYDNVGYARARGIEFEVNKRRSSYISGRINYTLQWANGYSSSAFDDYIRSINDFPKPIRERRLSWDVRHQVVIQATLNALANEHIKLFGIKLPDKWDITILSNISSGLPYTPGTTDPYKAQVKENTAEGPPIYNTDLKFKKYFQLGEKGPQLVFYIDIFNLFDQKNIQIAYGFNPWTGKPYRFGDVYFDTPLGYNWKEMRVLLDPRQFSTGRYAKLGISIKF